YFLWMLVFALFSYSLAPWVRRTFAWEFHSERSREDTFNLHFECLRGILALSVLFHHACITYFFYKNGKWEPPPSVFYAAIGPIAVTLFFVLSGYLFWRKARVAGGVPNVGKFFRARFRRILPVYYA